MLSVVKNNKQKKERKREMNDNVLTVGCPLYVEVYRPTDDDDDNDDYAGVSNAKRSAARREAIDFHDPPTFRDGAVGCLTHTHARTQTHHHNLLTIRLQAPQFMVKSRCACVAKAAKLSA